MLKKIAILLPDLRCGGAERLHITLAKHWLAEGYSITFILMLQEGDLLMDLPEDVNVVNLNVKRIRNVILPLVQYLRAHKPDILIAAMWPLTSVAVIANLLAGRPSCLFLSDHNQLSISCVEELNIPSFLVGFIMRLTYPLASGIVAVSEGVKLDMCRISGLASSSIKVIYNPTAIGISTQRESEEVKSELWGAGFKYHILASGNLKVQKDHATLINAFALLPKDLNAKLTIIGEGSLRFELEDLIKKLELQDRVAMPGYVNDPYPWYRSADLFVLSSRWEGFGNVLVEALECGTPVVSTDCPSGPAEILEDGRFGKLVPIQTPEALAICIRESLVAPVDRLQLMERAKAFSVTTIANQYIDYFLSKIC